MENILSITLTIAAGTWLILLLAAFFGNLLTTGYDYIMRHQKLWRKEEVEAEAVILHIEQTGLYINNKPQVRLQMQVKPQKGRNFVTEINDVQDVLISGLKPGSVVRVKYNPKNYRELLLIHAA